MKKIALMLSVVFCSAVATFAQNVNLNFNHCNDDKFTVLADTEENTVRLIVQVMNAPDQKMIEACKKIRLAWFFVQKDTVSGYGIQNHYYDGGVAFSWQYGQDNVILCDATTHAQITEMRYACNRLSLTFKMTKEQMAVLGILKGLPDDRTMGFSVANLSISN